jgi:hypothetical protein
MYQMKSNAPQKSFEIFSYHSVAYAQEGGLYANAAAGGLAWTAKFK